MFFRVSSSRPCHICRRKDWCTLSEDFAFCMRVSAGSFKTARNGAYMHRLKEHCTGTRLVKVSAPRPRFGASEDHLHLVFTSLLRMLGLSSNHLNSLLGRGFERRTIQENHYASAPTEERGNRIAAELVPLGLEGVPGFHKVGDRWRLVKLAPGILVPVRNERSQIVGIQIRHDDYGINRSRYVWLSSAGRVRGASSGAPLHWAKCQLLACAAEVLLTEGALKADLIAQFLGVPVIAAAGVALFGNNFGATLKRLYPDITAIICFDADWRVKPHVKAPLIALQRQLTAAGVKWRVRCWPSEHKGYDDYLFASRRKEAA
jgi:hypothetical protein